METAIVLVNYNGYVDTIECVQSLRKQTYKNFDIIVVDNASTDNSVEQIEKKCQDCILLRSKENKGFSAGNNIAIEYLYNISPKYILFLNNDTIVKEDFIEILLEGIEDNICVCPQMRFFSNKNIINYAGGYIDFWTGGGHTYNRGKKIDEFDERRREVKLAHGGGLLLTFNTLKKIGQWNEDYFMYREDDEYTLRMNSQNVTIYYEPKAILWHKECMSTGGDSGEKYRQYYLLRNRLYNITRYRFPKIVLFKTILAAYIKYATYIFVKNVKYKYLGEAIIDYRNGVIGKKNFIEE